MSTDRMNNLYEKSNSLIAEIGKIYMELEFSDSEELIDRANELTKELRTVQAEIEEIVNIHEEERSAQWWEAGCPQGDN